MILSVGAHNTAEVFMNKGMCSGRHRHEYPIIYFCLLDYLFITKLEKGKKKSAFSMGDIALVVAGARCDKWLT